MKPKKGFTLIELLVVIAIIALLLAITLPGLRAAKKLAALTIDLTNQKAVGNVWFLYTQANKDKIPDADVPDSPADARPTYSNVKVWCISAFPQDENGNFRHTSIEDEMRGIKRGALWPYLENPDSYRCPLNNGFTKQPTNYSATNTIGGWRSYSMGGVYSRWTLSNTTTNESKCVVTRFDEVTNPGFKILFLEEGDMSQGWNHRTWNIYIDRNNPRWYDPFAIWHDGRTTFSFVDGHAEAHKWVNESTLTMMEEDRQKLQQTIPAGQRDDYVWFIDHYVPRKLDP